MIGVIFAPICCDLYGFRWRHIGHKILLLNYKETIVNPLLRCFFLAIALIGCGSAYAQFPDKPITLVVPFPAGSTTDSVARSLSLRAQDYLGQPIIVENKPGAEGQLAAQDVARATADGYRITMATSGNLSLLPATRIKPPYNVMEDFSPIADIGRFTFVFYVNSNLPVKNLAEFAEHAKKHPGELTYATGNNTGIVTFAQLKARMGVDMAHVRYKGEPPAVLDLVAGRVDAMIGTTIGVPYVNQGRIRALAIMSRGRSAAFPSTPTLEESGFGQLPITSWAGVLGPKGMPADVVARISSAFTRAAADPKVQMQMDKLGFSLERGGPVQLRRLMEEQLTIHAQLVKQADLLPE